MEKFPIYTVGHGNRPIEIFTELLQRYRIKYLVDVRSQPYSQYNPQFSKDALKKYVDLHGIQYVFLGDALGGRPKDESCYDRDGKVEYAKLDVGFPKPITFIPKETLIRVSLSRWWKYDGAIEERCYLQLSGWYS